MRLNKSRPVEILVFVIAIIVFLVAMTYANYRFGIQSPGGADFVPRWLGTRLLMTEGLNPYSDEATAAIQQFKYGQPAKPHQDQLLFVYPLYSIMIFAPFSLTGDYLVARALWMTSQQAVLIIMVVIGLRLADWRPSAAILAGLLTFSLLWYHSFRPLINGNPAIISAFLISAGLMAIKNKFDLLAGFLLSLASIKPQMVILIIPLILLWAIFNRRHRLTVSVVGSFVILIGISSLILPGWIGDNLSQIKAYPTYTVAGTPGAIFSEAWPDTGPWLGYALTLMITIIMLWHWRKVVGQEYNQLLLASFITLAATNLIGIRTTTANFIALLPAVILILAVVAKSFAVWGPRLVWFLLAVLFFGLWSLFLITRSGNSQHPILFFPLPLFILITLSTLEFWAKRDSV